MSDWPWWVTALAALTASVVGVQLAVWLRWLIEQAVYDAAKDVPNGDPPTEGSGS